MQRVLLDRHGDGLIPDDYVLVVTARRFVAHAVVEDKLAVRGLDLCRWAEDFFKGRFVETVAVKSPSLELRAIFPDLDERDAAAICQAYGAALAWPFDQVSILKSIWPEFDWQGQPSRVHAARWLVWLAAVAKASYLPSLAAQAAKLFRSNASPELWTLYHSDQVEARLCLQHWLGLDESSYAKEWGAFPISVPSEWRFRAREIWANQLAATGLELFSIVRKRVVSNELLELLAGMCCEYCEHHPTELDHNLLQSLTPYLAASSASRLRQLLPPRQPSTVPTNREGIYNWFLTEYLPYRLWQADHGGNQEREIIKFLAMQFARWYLDIYPPALSGGDYNDQLAIKFARRLRESDSSDRVLVWVVLDGLNAADSGALVRLLQAEPRISIVNQTYALATLPTITRFCKTALMSGLPPVHAFSPHSSELYPAAIRLEANKDARTKTAAATSGAVYVWKIEEPDKSYHMNFDRPTVLQNVESKLETLARRIIDASLAVPNDLLVEIVISTDHGRMIGPSERVQPIPTGMQAHGRAAWGVSPVSFGGKNYVIDANNKLVYLSKTQFELDEDVCVVLDDSMFLKADASTGREVSTHGGLYPEEVITPWIELARDLTLPSLDATVSGNGRAGRPGKVMVAVTNPGAIAVIVVRLLMTFGAKTTEIVIDESIQPMSANRAGEISRDLPVWPTRSEIESGTALLVVELQNGLTFNQEAVLNLESEELYRQPSLRDLL